MIDKLELLFYYLLTPRSKEDKSLNKKENEIELTERVERYLSALRDPEIGPKIMEYIDKRLSEWITPGSEKSRVFYFQIRLYIPAAYF